MRYTDLIGEFVGTFFFVFVGCGTIIASDVTKNPVPLITVALAFGLALSIVVYILSDVSGAHINPAVTVGLALTKQFPAKKVLPYIVTQILGATFAAVMLWLIFGNTAQLGSTVLVNETSVTSGFMIEAILTLFLVFVVISSYKVSKSIVGFLIGGTLAADILLAGSLTMCSVNPARSLGPAIVSGTLTNQWLYIVAPLVGAVIAALLWKGLGETSQE